MKYVYVMQSASGLVKIGVSKNVSARLKSLQASSGLEIKLITTFGPLSKAIALERAAHVLLADKRELGEWFSVTADEAVKAVSSVEPELYCDASGNKKAVDSGSSISALERHLACFESEEEVMRTVQLLKISGLDDKAGILLCAKNTMSLSTRDCMHACQMALMQKKIDDMVSLMEGKAA